MKNDEPPHPTPSRGKGLAVAHVQAMLRNACDDENVHRGPFRFLELRECSTGLNETKP